MKERTEEEIKTRVTELWPDMDKWATERDKGPKIHVDPSRVTIEIGDMYDHPGFTFQQLMALSEFFETDNIADIDHDSSGGCETCDFGSYYSFTLEVKPGNWPIKSQS